MWRFSSKALAVATIASAGSSSSSFHRLNATTTVAHQVRTCTSSSSSSGILDNDDGSMSIPPAQYKHQPRAISDSSADEDISPEDLLFSSTAMDDADDDDGSMHFDAGSSVSGASGNGGSDGTAPQHQVEEEPTTSSSIPQGEYQRASSHSEGSWPKNPSWSQNSGGASSPNTTSNDVVPTQQSSSSSLTWSPQQVAYRRLLCSLRDAYYHDRSRLFWARHKARVEFYKHSAITHEEDITQLVNITNEVSHFVGKYMRLSIERIQRHNESILALSVPDAKKFREAYLLREAQHESWCKQKIRDMLQRRPPPPYPYC